jgi:hypothetical protein
VSNIALVYRWDMAMALNKFHELLQRYQIEIEFDITYRDFGQLA